VYGRLTKGVPRSAKGREERKRDDGASFRLFKKKGEKIRERVGKMQLKKRNRGTDPVKNRVGSQSVSITSQKNVIRPGKKNKIYFHLN